MYNKQQYKNVRHQATRRAQKWLKKLRHLEAIQVLFVSVANESPVFIKKLQIILKMQNSSILKRSNTSCEESPTKSGETQINPVVAPRHTDTDISHFDSLQLAMVNT